MEHKNGRVFLNFERSFSQEKIATPPDEFWPVYSWAWNSELSKEQTDRDLEEFKRLGIKALYVLPEPSTFRATTIPTTLSPGYMTPEYMEHYTYAVNKALELRIGLWFYDEAGWPSGSAGNIVLYDHPEYRKRILASRKKEFKKGEAYKKTDDCTPFLENGGMIDDGYVFSEDACVVEYYSKDELFPYPGMADYPDLSLKEATEYFLKVTHEEYKKYIGKEFGKNIPIVFTDEAVLPYPVPYRPDLEEEFEKIYGYSIRPCLPILNKDRMAVTEYEKRGVVDWYDFCSRLFCDNFLEIYKNWCHENDVAFSGHFNIDHIPNGSVLGRTFNLMRALRYLDIPGIDAIWRQIFPGERTPVQGTNIMCDNRFFPRYASSAASQIGSPRAMTECFAIYGIGFTFDEMRYVLNFQAMRGINLYNFMGGSYGEEKGFKMAGALPKYGEKYACYADFAHFNAYAGRVSYMTSIGKNVCDTALYLPIKDLYLVEDESEEVLEFDRAGRELENRQIPFDIFDDDVILSCDRNSLKNGVISMGDASYRTLVITEAHMMPSDVASLLEEFIKGGGKVFATREYICDIINGAEFLKSPSSALSSPLRFKGDTNGIRLMHRVGDNADIYYISNENYSSSEIEVCLDKKAYLLNLTDGKTKEYSGGEISLLSGEMVALIFTDEPLSVEKDFEYNTELSLDGTYTMRPIKQFVIDFVDSYSKDLSLPSEPVALGDWCEKLGHSFSGSCVYETEFSLDEKCDALLDLGVVKYSCEAFVNGVSLGVKVMPPYTFKIPSEVLEDKNTLTVRVSNTAANEYYHTDTFDKWPDWMLTSYFKTEQSFHPTSIPSGLFGPVKIYYNK